MSAPWLKEAFDLSLNLTHGRQLGLAFLLGSFSVATWSDLKRLSAQREFLEIWLVFLVGMLGYDLYEVRVRARVAFSFPVWPAAPWRNNVERLKQH